MPFFQVDKNISMPYIIYFYNISVNNLVGVCVLRYNFILKNLKTLRLKKFE